MGRFFNIAGPCNSRDHYMIDSMPRLSRAVRPLIEQGQYFLIHAARQSGKTTIIQELARQINAEGRYYALYCSLENAEHITDADKGINSILWKIHRTINVYGLPNAQIINEHINQGDASNGLQNALSAYCRSLDKPLVIFFDEADCLSDILLISFLRQLRNGYVERADIPFVHSLVLAGMRNLRDYRNDYRKPEESLGRASPFNIVAAYITLRNFNRDEIAALYAQYTAETGVSFDDAAIDLVWEQTQGQPWIVNAIAREAVETVTDNPICAAACSAAIQTLILRRDTHFDSLIYRLRQERIKRIIEPMIIGEIDETFIYSEDYAFAKDLGLIRDDRGKIEPANPIYGEMIVRVLNTGTQIAMGKHGYK